MSVLTILVEGIMALLMLALIVYCVKLNRGLGAIRGQDEQIKSMIVELNSAAERAEASVARLKAAGLQAEASVRAAIRDGEKLQTEMKPKTPRAPVRDENGTGAGEDADPAIDAALFQNNDGLDPAGRRPGPDRARDQSRGEAEAAVLQAIRAARGGV